MNADTLRTSERRFKNLATFSKYYVLPLYVWYLFGFLALIGTNIITLYVPQLAKQVVNLVEDLNQSHFLTKISLIIIGLGLLQIFVRSLSRILLFWPGRTLEAQVRLDLFSKLLRLPQRFFQTTGMGDLVSRVSNDTTDLRIFFAFGILQFANVICILAFTINQMMQMNLFLSILILIPLLISVISMKFGIPILSKYSKQNQEAIGKLTTQVTEAFINIQTVKLLNASNDLDHGIKKDLQKIYDTNIKLIFIRVFLFPIMGLMVGISQVIILWVGGSEVIAGRLSVGDIMAFNVYIGFLAFPLASIGIIISILQRCRTALLRLNDIQNQTSEDSFDHKSDSIKPVSIEAATQKASSFSSVQTILEIKDLNFSFNDDAQKNTPSLLFKNLNLKMYQGESLGIRGKVGSGKSTLLNLVTRIIDPPATTIYFKEKDVLNLHPDYLREKIFLCMQEAFLFAITVEENLRLGLDKNISMEELEEAAEKAQILEEVRRLPQGWKTEIGERGIRLSGGQKQRLSLARAFLRKPEILLLDDVLSAVDQKTEHALANVIASLNTTMLIASHRESVLQRCHRVLELKDGKFMD